MQRIALIGFVLALGLVGCATTGGERFATDDARDLTPAETVDGPEVFAGETVVWGGEIARVTNEAESTVIEVLYYPLGRDQRPDTAARAGDRFIAVEPGYLEPANYAPGRLVTVRGTLDGNRDGEVGEYPYTYPVVRVSDHELWPRPSEREGTTRTRIHFGFGVIFN